MSIDEIIERIRRDQVELEGWLSQIQERDLDTVAPQLDAIQRDWEKLREQIEKIKGDQDVKYRKGKGKN